MSADARNGRSHGSHRDEEVWDTPRPPTNIRLVFADDLQTEVPVGCTYAGVEASAEGIPIDVWLVDAPTDREAVQLLADILPAHSSLRVQMAAP